jgi:phosphoribosyl 1,2-cyclic phosphodiesterase
VADAVAFTRAVGARRLLLFHHEPAHSDALLEELEAQAQSLEGGGAELRPELAREGMVVDVP